VIRLLAMLLGLAFLVPGPVTADDERAKGTDLELFDGESLAGWTIENDCEVVVDDGDLLLKSGDGWLRSNHEYTDFRLHVEWMALQEQAHDAGIYVRAAPGGKGPFPKQGYQINLLEDQEGALIRFPGKTAAHLAKPAGEWNTFEIEVVGDRLTLHANGEKAYTAEGLEIPKGHVGFQVEVPKGGQYRIRNVRLTELTHRPLFDGDSFAGWIPSTGEAAQCWQVEDGQLVCTGEKGPWLRTEETFGDFNLRLRYQVAEGGNSGIYVRIPANGNHHHSDEKEPPAGFEVQVLDDNAEKYTKLKSLQFTGALYGIVGPSQRVARPAGTWNELEIDCKDSHVVVVHNGVRVVDATGEEHPALALRKVEGHLGLQNHSTVVRYRDLRIGPSMQE
jgi:hypothetical protein